MRYQKAQSAIEYLMTYGWMLLVVAIVGGTIFATVGGSNIQSVQGFNSNDFSIQDFGVSDESGLMLSFRSLNNQIELREITVSGSESDNTTYMLNKDISENNLVNLPGVRPVDGDNTVEVQIIYNSGGLRNISTEGSITGSFEVDDDFEGETMILDGLVGYWPLSQKYSDGSQVYDLSQYNNHGVKANNPVWTEGLVSDQALEFDGEDDAVDVSDSQSISMTDSLTVSMWLNLNDAYSKNDKSSHYLFKSGAYGIFNSGPSVTKEGNRNYVGSSDPPTNELVHIAGVYDGTELVEYQNGSQVASVEVDAPIDDSPSRLRIGNAGGYDWAVDGSIDEVHIYNRELSQNEVDILYSQAN